MSQLENFYRGAKGPFTSSDCNVAATLFPNLIYCFGVVLLHQAFVTATVINFAVTGELLCKPFGSDVTDVSLLLDVNGL